MRRRLRAVRQGPMAQAVPQEGTRRARGAAQVSISAGEGQLPEDWWEEERDWCWHGAGRQLGRRGPTARALMEGEPGQWLARLGSTT